MKNIKALALVVVLFCIPARSAVFADMTFAEAKDALRSSAVLYNSGDYDKALSLMLDIADAGFESGDLYYDLGNCYLKKFEIGKAILYYEAAKRFIPRDSALAANEKYARLQMKQQDPASGRAALLRLIEGAFEYLTFGELLFLLDAMYYLMAACFVSFFFMRRFRGRLGALTVLFLCGILILIIPVNGKVRDIESLAIVVVPVADARLEPAEEGDTVFPLYGGMKVYILKTTRNWIKIKRLDDKVAWIKKGAVELIDCPRQSAMVY